MTVLTTKMLNAQFEALLKIAPESKLEYSTFTGKWYVTNHLWIGRGDGFVSGTTCHVEKPEEAILNYLNLLRNVCEPGYLTNTNQTRYWRWYGDTSNPAGGSFVEIVL